jgi:hypothetical protein
MSGYSIEHPLEQPDDMVAFLRISQFCAASPMNGANPSFS